MSRPLQGNRGSLEPPESPEGGHEGGDNSSRGRTNRDVVPTPHMITEKKKTARKQWYKHNHNISIKTYWMCIRETMPIWDVPCKFLSYYDDVTGVVQTT